MIAARQSVKDISMEVIKIKFNDELKHIFSSRRGFCDNYLNERMVRDCNMKRITPGNGSGQDC